AIADCATGPIAFYEAPIAKFGMGALAPQFDASPTMVDVMTLDNLLSDQGIARVDALKVDVEGFEAAVFRGAERVLTGPRPPIVVFEFCDWAERRARGTCVGDAQRLIRDYGFTVSRLRDFGAKAPLCDLLLEGSEMLVACKN